MLPLSQKLAESQYPLDKLNPQLDDYRFRIVLVHVSRRDKKEIRNVLLGHWHAPRVRTIRFEEHVFFQHELVSFVMVNSSYRTRQACEVETVKTCEVIAFGGEVLVRADVPALGSPEGV
jgi:hypothetical protein